MGMIDVLSKKNRENRIMEATQYDPYVDLEIIGAFSKQTPTKIKMIPTPVPLYRCYFIEDDVVVTYLTHLLAGEYKMFTHIVKNHTKYGSTIQMFVLTDNKVIESGLINVHTLAHLLFRFHNRIAKKYIEEERFLY